MTPKNKNIICVLNSLGVLQISFLNTTLGLLKLSSRITEQLAKVTHGI